MKTRGMSPSTEYGDFLGSLANKGKNTKAYPHVLSSTIDQWEDVDLDTDEGKIANEISRVSNDIRRINPEANIAEFKYTTKPNKNSSNFYYAGIKNNKYVPMMQLVNAKRSNPPRSGGPTKVGNIYGPDPNTTSHEQIHYHDHQKHNLNADIWGYLSTLGQSTDPNTGSSIYPNFSSFQAGLQRIQNKIDPSGIFASYHFDPEYIGQEMQAGRETYGIPNTAPNQYTNTTPYLPPGSNAPNLAQLFTDIDTVTRHVDPTVHNNNPGFFLNRASEFAGFAGEPNLITRNWDTKDNGGVAGTPSGPNALQPQEARFLHNVLGSMETAYPVTTAPTFNRYIKARRNSIDTAYHGVPGYAQGGYVTDSARNNYDPYLNTYNYAPPLRLSEYLTDQMPDPRYEDGGYGDPYMSYGNAYDNDGAQYSFKEGGLVKEEDLPRLADLIQRYGRNGDTELAHINPIEAHILKSLGGSGTINPATGLREYSFFKNPFKAIKSVLGGGAGAIIGNMIAPGIGGIIGGAIGQGAQHAARGKSALAGALKGAGMGAALPSVASGLGWGASKLGASALGSSLSNYGSTNAILPALGMGSSSGSSGLFGLGGSNPYVSGGLSAATALSSGMGTGRGQGLGVNSGDYVENYYNYMLDRQKKQDNMGFTDKLQDYLTQPGNLLTLGTVAAQYAGRQKPKSPEKIAEEERRYRNASRKTIAEVEADEALETARGDLQKKRKNKRLDEDIKNMGSVRRRVVSPEEFARTGRWLEYTDEEGRPLRMKGGGSIKDQAARSEVINKGKQLTDDIIAKNLSQNNGKLDERSLIGEFSNLTQILGLTEAERNTLERYSEGLFKNLQFTGDPGYFYRQTHNIPQMKSGGSAHSPYAYLMEEIYSPLSPIGYLSGDSGGQDDLIDARLSDGEYVFDASTVSDLGDGNNAAGARKLDVFRENIRRHKRGGKVMLPPRAKSLESYLRG